jgi:hypothetical protein
MPEIRRLFQRPAFASLMRGAGAKMAATRRNLALARGFREAAQPFRHIGVTHTHPVGAIAAASGIERAR